MAALRADLREAHRIAAHYLRRPAVEGLALALFLAGLVAALVGAGS